MIISPPVIEDYGELVDLAISFHTHMNYPETRRYELPKEHIQQLVFQYITSGTYVTLKATEKNNIVGYIVIMLVNVNHYHFGKTLPIEIIWNADPKLSGSKQIRIMSHLLQSMEHLLSSMGLTRPQIGAEFTGSLAVQKLLLKKGYKPRCLTFS